MKYYIYILVPCFLFFSCKKDNDLQTRFTGKYELIKKIQGEGSPTFETYPPGNGRTLTLLEGGIYEFKHYDTLLSRDSYSLKQAVDCNSTSIELFFVTSGNRHDQLINLDNDTLIIRTSRCLADGVVSHYKKLH